MESLPELKHVKVPRHLSRRIATLRSAEKLRSARLGGRDHDGSAVQDEIAQMKAQLDSNDLPCWRKLMQCRQRHRCLQRLAPYAEPPKRSNANLQDMIATSQKHVTELEALMRAAQTPTSDVADAERDESLSNRLRAGMDGVADVVSKCQMQASLLESADLRAALRQTKSHVLAIEKMHESDPPATPAAALEDNAARPDLGPASEALALLLQGPDTQRWMRRMLASAVTHRARGDGAEGS